MHYLNGINNQKGQNEGIRLLNWMSTDLTKFWKTHSKYNWVLTVLSWVLNSG